MIIGSLLLLIGYIIFEVYTNILWNDIVYNRGDKLINVLDRVKQHLHHYCVIM